MRRRKAAGLALGLAVLLFGPLAVLGARQAKEAVRIDADDLGGVVTSAKGPEAGVWVIAETKDLQAPFTRIVVTDDRGRYVVPDLPEATYSVWVRGYGLVDSPKVTTSPGRRQNLTAVVAPSARAAADYYPANYWLSLMRIPPASDFPGTGRSGNGIAEGMRTQSHWISHLKSECLQCHQIGTKITRDLVKNLGAFTSTNAAWARRLESGQAGNQMVNALTRFGRDRALEMFTDWSDRIAAGEVPDAPPRPQGVERNIVITQWDWANALAYVHDVTSTDKNNPTSNPYGLVYGNDRYNTPEVITLDPVRNVVTKSIVVPVRDKDTSPSQPQTMLRPSPYWGEEIIWNNQANMHNPMFDSRGRVWMTSAIRGSQNPAFCRKGSTHPSAQLVPLERSSRQLSMYDPSTKKMTLIDTCFSTHHLQFATDANRTLWLSGGGNVVGFLNTKMLEETGDPVKSQGWIPYIVDTNGNGRQDAYVEVNEPVDPTKDKRISGSSGGEGGFNLGFYGVAPNPVDGSVWGAIVGTPGAIIRVSPGANPPHTSLAEVYEPPLRNPAAPNDGYQGYTPRGIDIDRNGVVWTGLSASGHLASFDRRKCKVLNGPTALGQHCPEGWTLYPSPGPQFKGVTETGSADFHYFNWVDQFDTFGLGTNTPMLNGTESDSLMALHDGTWVTIRVPYPMGFFTRGMDGRIDDPKAGWKGRGLWVANNNQPAWHAEGGKGATSRVMHIQLRPDPLAK